MPPSRRSPTETGGRIAAGLERIARLVRVDQKPIGRTPRSNLATYTGLFDGVRKLFAATPRRARAATTPGRFSFNVAKGRCETCEGEGFVSVELLFMPSVYAPCPACHGARYNEKTLEVRWQGPQHRRGAGADGRRRLRLCSPTSRRVQRRWRCCRRSASATCASASRRPSSPAAKRSGSSSRPSCSGRSAARSLYVLDEPTTGLHPADVDQLMAQLAAAWSMPATR